MIRKSLTFLAAAALAAAPAVAQSSASALSIAPAIERAGPGSDDSELAGGIGFPVIFALAIVVAGVLTATGVIFDDDDDAVSP